MAHGNIQLGNYAPQLIQSLLSLVRNNAIGAIIDRHRAAITTTVTFSCGNRLKQLSNIGCLRIVDLNKLTAQWGQLGYLVLRLKLLAFPSSNFIRGRNQKHIPYLTLVEATGLQNKIQCLVPRYILQAQSNTALHCIAGHKIKVGKIRNQLKHGADINILKIERQLFTSIRKALSLTLFNIILAQRFYINSQLIVSLESQVIIETCRLN